MTSREIQKEPERNKRLDDENVDLKMKQKEYENGVNSYCNHCTELEQQLEEIKSQNQSLKQKNKNLEAEASKYQSALGIATNFDLNVDDQGDSVKLNKDILELHDTLENYVTNLKPKINVNINEAKKLLNKYGCQTNISEEEPNKPLIKAVLQRHVLEEILTQANYFFMNFKYSNKDHHLESEIVDRATYLTGLMEKLYNNRLGNDEITRLIPIRLRQQVYTALGTRGFNDIKKPLNNYSKHNFIDIISKRMNKIMNQFRRIKDNEKRKYVNSLAEDLVRNAVKIFYFRLPIQEPKAEYRWFENDEKVNKSYMKGSWNDDDIKNLVVEVCAFPMICRQHPDGLKVFTPAKVFTRRYKKRNLIGKFTDKIRKKLTPNDNSVLSLQGDYGSNDSDDSGESGQSDDDDSDDSDDSDNSDDSGDSGNSNESN
ncbi:hypothetical protein RhiirA5_350525 [Rhizophagus irregularis]|uniref:Uncharacterized protein n=1 Tax=Rhizophagus irregularis TaxID=588596 RepID=A0A2I1E8S0_9GLOM|nr:hypothetical protein RhiirA5_350525 [Rhizophagus irregularis]PKC69701.1 hypothetical protein RhiirA1_415275 [Rhizophagus irregularis]PKY18501.1 hypothetical protein RhiirB3_405655 [Rhizophagus irregularis]CAB5201055.1 unnamed protein product [Rhizophagus irregularis]